MMLQLSKILLILVCAVIASVASALPMKPLHYKNTVDLESLFQHAIADHAFPGGCIAAGTADTLYVNQCYGYFTYEQKQPVTKDNLFDIASLTKVIATTPAIMQLYEQKRLDIDAKVIKYLPDFQGPTAAQTDLKAQITLRQLLTHTSGLPPDNYVDTWPEIYHTPIVAYPGRQEIYSDINFLLLAKIVEKVSGTGFETYVKQYITQPLHMSHTQFNLPASQHNNALPTEYAFSLNKPLQGVAHDPVARHLGGVAGNAGLFSTMGDLVTFARMMLTQGTYHDVSLLQPATVATFTRRANMITGSSRALGWDTAYDPKAVLPQNIRSSLHYPSGALAEYYGSPKQFTAGNYIDDSAYGHTGYTGTSLWISPKHGVFVLLLTNRVFPYVDSTHSMVHVYWRQQINSAVWRNLGFTEANSLVTYAKPNHFVSESYRWHG